MIRDDEIKRLRNYAKGLGCKVIIKTVKKIKQDYAICDYGNHVITIFKCKKVTKTDLVLSLIHEISHYKAFISKNRKPSKTEDKIVERYLNSKVCPPYINYYIYCFELKEQRYWDQIIKDCNIKISKKRIELQKEIDLISYETMFLFGEEYTKEISNYFKKLIKRIHNAS